MNFAQPFQRALEEMGEGAALVAGAWGPCYKAPRNCGKDSQPAFGGFFLFLGLTMGAALGKYMSEDKGWDRCCYAWHRWLHPMLHYGTVPLVFAVGLAASGELTANPLTLFRKLIVN